MKKFPLASGILFCFCAVSTNAAALRDSVGAENCLCSVGASAITSTTRKITLAQAKALVMAALTPEERRAPGVMIYIPDKNPDDILTYKDRDHPRFLIFNVIWDSPGDSSNNIGFYAVDIYTGDVFSAVSICAEYYGKKLATLQEKIRHSLYLTKIDYHKLKTNGPECVGSN